MKDEKDIIYLISLVSLGIIIISSLITFLDRFYVFPFVIIEIILFILILFLYKKETSHFTENLEKIIFIITFVIIVSTFILKYKPI